MKHGFTLAIALFFSVALFAQVETGKPLGKKNELGVEVTNFYGLINTNFTSRNPYTVTYRRHFGTWALRAGGGSVISTAEDKQDGASLGKATTMSLHLSAGYERQIWFGTRWGFYYGADLTMHRAYNGITETFGPLQTITETDTERFGFAPLVGFRFRANKRLSLGTTANYWLGSNKVSTTITSKNFEDPSQDNVSKAWSEGILGSFNAPYSIYLLFDF